MDDDRFIFNSQRFTLCAICNRTHRADDPRCLDCHGDLELIGPSVFRCRYCYVKHTTGFGRLSRSGSLTHISDGKLTDYSDRSVLSKRLKRVG